MAIQISLPEINVKEEELKILLATKLLEEGIVSLGKAADIAGYTESTFSEILLRRGVSPVKYENLDLDNELKNA